MCGESIEIGKQRLSHDSHLDELSFEFVPVFGRNDELADAGFISKL